MCRTPILISFICVLAITFSFARADWWDDLKQSVSEKFDQGSEFAQNVAAPVIKDTWENAKTAVADSDAHTWVKESALPAIKTKLSDVKTFIHDKTAPEDTTSGGSDELDLDKE